MRPIHQGWIHCSKLQTTNSTKLATVEWVLLNTLSFLCSPMLPELPANHMLFGAAWLLYYGCESTRRPGLQEPWALGLPNQIGATRGIRLHSYRHIQLAGDQAPLPPMNRGHKARCCWVCVAQDAPMSSICPGARVRWKTGTFLRPLFSAAPLPWGSPTAPRI
jgi:hypothetical protein